MVASKMSPLGMTSNVAIEINAFTIILAKSGNSASNRGRLVMIYKPLIMPQTWDMAPDIRMLAPRVAAVAACVVSAAAPTF